jgi:CTD small phosphatase-like protein 2
LEVENEGRVIFRPYLDEFLSQMSKYYEIYIFTASVKEYADLVINAIDPESKMIAGRYYRDHMTKVNDNYHIKDLEILGKDLKKVIIIDNIFENFEKQPHNGILIKSWYNDEEDNKLIEILPFLTKIVEEQIDDVRVYLKKFRENMIENIQKGSIHFHSSFS